MAAKRCHQSPLDPDYPARQVGRDQGRRAQSPRFSSAFRPSLVLSVESIELSFSSRACLTDLSGNYSESIRCYGSPDPTGPPSQKLPNSLHSPKAPLSAFSSTLRFLRLLMLLDTDERIEIGVIRGSAYLPIIRQRCPERLPSSIYVKLHLYRSATYPGVEPERFTTTWKAPSSLSTPTVCGSPIPISQNRLHFDKDDNNYSNLIAPGLY